MYKIILAVRFMLSRRISYFAVAATGLCVFVAFVVITVLSGLTAQFKRYIHSCFCDCVISSKSLVGFGYYEQFMEVLGDSEIVECVSPVIRGYAHLRGISDSNQSHVHDRDAAMFVGIDAGMHSRVTAFGEWLSLHKGDAENAFVQAYDPNLPGCVPGVAFLFESDSEGNYKTTKELPRVRFEVSMFPLTAKGAPRRAGLGEVSTKTFYCSDYTQTGHIADWRVICLPFDEAQKLCGMGTEPKRVNALYVKFKPGVHLAKGCERISRLWGEFVEAKASAAGADLLDAVRVQTWKTHNRAIVAIADMQQTLMIVIFALVGMVAVFIVFAVFYMIVSQKSKDIGILKSVGVSDGNVLLLFLVFGLLVGILGSVVGALGGWQFIAHIEQIHDRIMGLFKFPLLVGLEYDIRDVPNQISFKVLAAVIFAALAACLVGALVPSWRAARLRPVQSLQVSRL